MLALKLIEESREKKNIIFAGKILIDLITKYCYMKKNRFIMNLLAVVSAVVLGGALLSCDNELQESVDDLKDRVTALEEAMSVLQGNVDAVTSLLEEGRVIKSITPNEDGTAYTITYVGSDETDVITVGTGNPVITVMADENGVYYWARIGENGEPEYLTVDGEKVPVGGGVSIRFRNEDKGLEISTDNGGTWTDAGVSLDEYGMFMFKSVTFDGDYVIFTLQDGTELRVLRTAEFVCDILCGKTLFEMGETKALPVSASGYEKYEISAPFGWTAEFTGNTIEVTAPYDASKDTAGEIVLRVYADGKVLMDKVRVTTEVQTITVGTEVAEDGAVDIVVSTIYPMYPFYCGVAKLSEFSAEAAAGECDSDHEFATAVGEGGSVEPARIPFTDLVENPEVGETYVIWTFEVTGLPADPDDIQTYFYDYGRSVAVEIGEPVFNNVDITLTPAGEGTEYVIFLYPKDQFYGYYGDVTEYRDEDLQAAKDGLATMITRGMYDGYFTGEAIRGTFAELNTNMYLQTTVDISAGETYILLTAVKKSISGVEYSAGDIQSYEFTLADYTMDGTAEIECGEPEITSSSIAVPYTWPDNMYEIYYACLDEDSYNEWNGAGMVESMLENIAPVVPEDLTGGDADPYMRAEDLEPGTTVHFVAFVVDSEGRIGPLTDLEFASAEIGHNEDISLSVKEHSASEDGISVKFDITGNPAKLIYYYCSESSFEYAYPFEGDTESVKNEMAINPDSYYWNEYSSNGGFVTLAEGQTSCEVNISGLSMGTGYIFIATVVDAYGVTSSTFVEETYSTTSPDIVEKSDPSWSGMQPVFGEVEYEAGLEGVIFANVPVTVGDGVDTWYAWFEYGDTYEATSAEAVRDALSQTPKSGDATMRRMLFEGDTYTLVCVVVDKEGKYYAPSTFTVTYPAE